LGRSVDSPAQERGKNGGAKSNESVSQKCQGEGPSRLDKKGGAGEVFADFVRVGKVEKVKGEKRGVKRSDSKNNGVRKDLLKGVIAGRSK